VILYEMLAGIHPFKKATGMDTAGAILKDVPQSLREIRADIPILLQHIVKKMLAKDPRDRYSSIHDARTDLKGLLEAETPANEKRSWLRPWQWIVAGALVTVGAGIWTFWGFFPRQAELPPPRFVPVTTSGGGSPSLSPDGSWVAFEWNGEKHDNDDIYVKELDGPGFNRLTTDPASDGAPAWSPDGRQIAFLRNSGEPYPRNGGERTMLYLISPLGGGERKLAEGVGRPLSWSPDGKNIAFVDRKSPEDVWSIWSLSLETLERKQITAPDLSYVGDTGAAFSPNGLYLAFIRHFEVVRTALYVMKVAGGEPRLVTDYNSPVQPCWTADSREIVFRSHGETGEKVLWRIFVDGSQRRAVPAPGEKVSEPSVSRNRLAYVSTSGNYDIWRLDLTDDMKLKPPSKALINWSSSEIEPHISPDGSRIAFSSNSSGNLEIWTCNADGSRPMKLTDMKAAASGCPNWSPDGKWIAFDSTKSGNSDLYMVSVDGGPVRRLTTDPGEEVVPRWSRDGRWIYFGSNRSGSWQVWRMSSEGGKAIQLTRGGGMTARESLDGQFVYYYGYYTLEKKGIWRVPVSGGPETLVLDKSINPHRWDVTGRGIYFIDTGSKPMATICLYDFATRRVRSLPPVHNDPAFTLEVGVTVSPDGKWLLYSGGVFANDIMMIDNFR
jgi:Tol biopolymer transport system component